ncbi:MAG TPA: TRAP transporter large permease [Burkholderiaceae bacterium]|nr:TRAP transporter large permease [Burkholderiaceae bacterium]HQR75790.1 TRAP transporter large permease [Burkholderiaceae bacterium]
MADFGIIVAVLCALLVLGFPVAFALGIAGAVGLVLTDQSLEIIPEVLYSAADSFVLLAIPLFVLMSRILMKAGISDELFALINAFVRHVAGGMAAGAVLCCAFFAAISGSSVTNAAAVGMVAIPALVKHGYPKRFAAGLVAAGGTLGILIPPSIPFIVYGAITDQSVGALFLAGVVPGLVVTVLILVYAVAVSRLRGYGTPGPPIPWGERLGLLLRNVPVLALPVLILGGIYSGVFTPTEAAAAALVLAEILASTYFRRLSLKMLWEATRETVNVSVMILTIVAGAKLFGHVSTTMQIPQGFADWIQAANIGQFEFIAAVMILLIFLGDFLDPISIILIVVPVLLPALTALQIDPIWFGVLIVINMELANITPPVGLNLFVIQAIQKDISFQEVLRGTVPFMFAIVVALLLIWWEPRLATWLPAMAR